MSFKKYRLNRYNRWMTYTFKELEPEILAALNDPIRQKIFGVNANLVVMDSFVTLPLQPNIGDGMVLGGQQIPSVVVINQATGQIFTFSLKLLVPRIELS